MAGLRKPEAGLEAWKRSFGLGLGMQLVGCARQALGCGAYELQAQRIARLRFVYELNVVLRHIEEFPTALKCWTFVETRSI